MRIFIEFSSPIFVITASQGDEIDWNRKSKKMFGRPENELLTIDVRRIDFTHPVE